MGGDKVLIVRDRATGRPIAISISSIPVEIRPDNWFENGYWRYRPDRGRLEPIISKFLNRKRLDPFEVEAAAQYIVDYACHIAVMGYLFGGKDETLDFNVECIRRLRALRATASSREDVSVMISVGMDYALDPL